MDRARTARHRPGCAGRVCAARVSQWPTEVHQDRRQRPRRAVASGRARGARAAARPCGYGAAVPVPSRRLLRPAQLPHARVEARRTRRRDHTGPARLRSAEHLPTRAPGDLTPSLPLYGSPPPPPLSPRDRSPLYNPPPRQPPPCTSRTPPPPPKRTKDLLCLPHRPLLLTATVTPPPPPLSCSAPSYRGSDARRRSGGDGASRSW